MNSPLAISIIWGIYQIIPYALVLFYWLISKGVMLQYMCRLGLVLQFVSGAAAVGLMWGLYPPSYNFGNVRCPAVPRSALPSVQLHTLVVPESPAHAQPWKPDAMASYYCQCEQGVCTGAAQQRL